MDEADGKTEGFEMDGQTARALRRGD